MEYTSIISPDDVFSHLDNPHWRIVDCQYNLQDHNEGYLHYCQEHIPNAIYAHLKNDLAGPTTPVSGRHPLPGIDQFIQTVGRWGIDQHTQVIVYDNAQGSFAARLWWLLHWLGHHKVAVLNGGLSRWKHQGYPLSSEIPHITPTTFAGQADYSLIIDSNDIEDMLPNESITLIDVRDPERFQGLKEPIDKIAGHIPNAINIPWKSNLDPQGMFLSPDQLRALYDPLLQQRSSDHTVFMCGSGVTACHSLVALAYAGIIDAKLYPGSWSEWITNPDHPIKTGAA